MTLMQRENSNDRLQINIYQGPEIWEDLTTKEYRGILGDNRTTIYILYYMYIYTQLYLDCGGGYTPVCVVKTCRIVH